MAYTAWSVIAGETPTATKWNVLGGNDADFDTRIAQLVEDKTLDEADDGATVTLDMAERRLWKVQIAGDRTIEFDNVEGKKPFAVFIQQDGSGGRTVTWPAGIEWPGGVEPTLSAGANLTDGFMFIPKEDWVETSNEVYYGLFIGFGIEAVA